MKSILNFYLKILNAEAGCHKHTHTQTHHHDHISFSLYRNKVETNKSGEALRLQAESLMKMLLANWMQHIPMFK